MDGHSRYLQPDAAAPGLWTGTFPSGLRLVVREDHRLPVAVANVWVRVGSNREPEDLRGWSHGIEHMLFKGTTRRGEADFALEVAEAGGSTNAGTGYETTNYHITVPAGNLAAAVDLLGDALLRSTFAPEALDPEREVLVHENHMYDDQPFGFGLTWRLGLERAFDISPYRHPIGGRDENLRERSRDDILAFWRSAYRPDNMTVVVVGDVDPAEVEQLVTAGFPVTAADAPPTAGDARVSLVESPPVEPPHDAARLRRTSGELRKAYAKLIFAAPGGNDHRHDVLPVVRRVLGDGRSCRLYRRVQEEAKLVDDFSVAVETGPREGVVVIDLETDSPRLGSAIRAVAAVLGELGRDGCTAEERERAATRVRRAHIFGLETVQGQASNLGYHDAVGDLGGAFTLPERVAAVTPDQVAGLCRELFRPGTTTVMIYLPDGDDPEDLPADDDALQAMLEEAFVQDTGSTTTDGPWIPPAAVRARRSDTGSGDFQLDRLASGIEVHWRHDPALPVVAMAFSVPGGASRETAADAGLAALTRAVQLKGAAGRSSTSLHEALENLGSDFYGLGGRDHDGFMLTALADRLEPALELAAEFMLRPDFPAAEVEHERRLTLAQLQAWQDDPFQAAVLEMRHLLYGDHPYGRPQVGTPDSLPGLDADLLRAHYARTWNPDALQVVVSGDIDSERLLPALERLLGGLPAGDGAHRSAVASPAPLADVITRRLGRQQNQSVVLLGWHGAPNAEAHRVPLLMLREVLNGQSGRLFDQLRNRRSLCYNTGLLGTAGRSRGMLLGYVLTAPDTTEAAREAMLVEIGKMVAERVPTPEFERARTKLLGNLLISDQTQAARTGRRAGDLILERPQPGLQPLLKDIGGVTPDQVRDAAATYLRDDAYRVVILGPQGDGETGA